MSSYTITTIIILALGLYRNYQIDIGQHIKAKIFHATCLTFFCLGFAGSFGRLGSLLRHYDIIKAVFSPDVGNIQGEVYFYFYLAEIALAITLLILSYTMINRNEKARKLLIMILPVLAIVKTFSFYRSLVNGAGDLGLNNGFFFLGSIGISGGLAALFILIYKNKFMLDFFKKSLLVANEETSPLLDPEWTLRDRK